jgi:hypothetical protein
MPIRLADIEKYGAPISFLGKGEVQVRVGPCSATFLQDDKIPLDGRHYICAGTIILRDGTKLRANFEINTHTFDFLERETVSVFIDSEKAWYNLDEQELYAIIGVDSSLALPYLWLPDKPLDYYKDGPYPMKWPEDEKE